MGTAIRLTCLTPPCIHTVNRSMPVDLTENHVPHHLVAEEEADQGKFLTTAPIPRVMTISKLLNVREDQLILFCGSMSYLTLFSRKSMERLKNTSSTRSFSSSLPVKMLKVVTARRVAKVCLKETLSE